MPCSKRLRLSSLSVPAHQDVKKFPALQFSASVSGYLLSRPVAKHDPAFGVKYHHQRSAGLQNARYEVPFFS
jgi:hypothetical protein